MRQINGFAGGDGQFMKRSFCGRLRADKLQLLTGRRNPDLFSHNMLNLFAEAKSFDQTAKSISHRKFPLWHFN